jgi:hypothetical protein
MAETREAVLEASNGDGGYDEEVIVAKDAANAAGFDHVGAYCGTKMMAAAIAALDAHRKAKREPKASEASVAMRVGSAVKAEWERFMMGPDGDDAVKETRALGRAALAALRDPNHEMIEVGRMELGTWQDIPGSGLTVAREKMRRRWNAMVEWAIARG